VDPVTEILHAERIEGGSIGEGEGDGEVDGSDANLLGIDIRRVVSFRPFMSVWFKVVLRYFVVGADR